ncbi:MAG: ABC transporter permease [Deltaproteobacteria bacterium]|nr:ABC transporter permease [Deltaproteobacteria bacterium]
MKILVLAGYTWKRMARAHYLKGLYAFAFVVLMLVMGMRSDVTSQSSLTGLMEFGMRAARGGALLAAIWIGASIFSGELASYTARTLLTKPVRRFDAVFGVLLGGMAYVTLLLVVATAVAFIASILRGWQPSLDILVMQLSVLPAIFAVLALAQLVSFVSPKPITIFLMLGLSWEHWWRYVGNSLDAGGADSWIRTGLGAMAKTAYYVTPTYSRFVPDYEYFRQVGFPAGAWAFHSVACVAYVFTCCVLTAYVLSREEI